MNKKLYLIRCISFSDKTIGGALIGIDKEKDTFFKCLTLELPYLDNAKNISSIPANKYMVFKKHSNRFGMEVLEVMSVPMRQDILIHPGNTSKDTNGCILVGYKFGMLNGLPAVLQSRNAFKDLMLWWGDDISGVLEITSFL